MIYHEGIYKVPYSGEMAEWLKAAVLKTADEKLSESSNLSLSENNIKIKNF